jgi:hypothetical protein
MADLGLHPPSNAYLTDLKQALDEPVYPLRACVCADCRLVQLDVDIPPRQLFHDYAYFSSYSTSWLEHARDYVRMAIDRFSMNGQSFVVELASNDGYLLRNFVEAGIPCLGVEPSATVARAAETAGVPTLNVFFGKDTAERIVAERGRADLIVANNVWAHIPDITDFSDGVAALLKPGGVATIEVQHLLRLMETVAFDTIYHEHFEYHSLLAAERVLARSGLRLFDAEQLPTHGGSLRLYVGHAADPGHREGAGVARIREEEMAAGLDTLEAYQSFSNRVDTCRTGFLAFLKDARSKGLRVWAYGAAAKGNTLLNACGVDSALIAAVADKNPFKQGRYLPGSHIPIVSPQDLLDARPDIVVILPWNLRREIMDELSAVAEWGGRFATPVPDVRLYP